MTSKNKKRATIKDIAALLGVHHSTVSRALSPSKKSQISPDVVKKVTDAANELGYFPNLMASSLKQNRSFAIGVIIPDLQNSMFPTIIRGIQDAAEAANYSVMIVNTDDVEEREHQALRTMRSRSIEGIIVATARRQDKLVEECILSETPCVLINRTVDEGPVNAIILDEKHTISSILDHLTELGHSRIAHIAGPQHTSTGFERASEFKRGMRARKLDNSLVETTQKFTVEAGYQAFKKLHARHQDFTAVVGASDSVALGCMDAIKELGLKVPQDISVVGNNDMPFVARISPSLTTMAIPKYQMGKMAVETLFGITEDAGRKPEVIRLHSELIVRESTAPPRKL